MKEGNSIGVSVLLRSLNIIVLPPTFPLTVVNICLCIEKVLYWVNAGVQPRPIQGIRSGDGVGDLFNYLFIKDIKSNKMRIAQ